MWISGAIAFMESILDELTKYTGMPRNMALGLIKEYFEGIALKLENLNNSLKDNKKENSLRLVHNIKGTTAIFTFKFFSLIFYMSLEEAISA